MRLSGEASRSVCWLLAAGIRITGDSTAVSREQLRILDAAVEAGAGAVDVEIESAESLNHGLDLLRGKSTLIISFHNQRDPGPL